MDPTQPLADVLDLPVELSETTVHVLPEEYLTSQGARMLNESGTIPVGIRGEWLSIATRRMNGDITFVLGTML